MVHARVKTPTMLQFEMVECGAASLGIILGYYGKFKTLEELRVSCGISRDGSKAGNVLRAAKSYGLEASGWKKELEAVKELEPPFIAFWNFAHFLVVEGMDSRHVYLNDPATGPRKIGWDEFDKGFTGVVLTFKPGPDFKPEGRPASLFRGLAPRLRGSGKGLLFVILAGLALVIPGVVAPTFKKIFIDEYLVLDLKTWVLPLLWVMGATTLLMAGLKWLQQYYLLRVHVKMSVSTSSRFFWHVLRLPVGFFSQRFAGEIGSRVALNDKVSALLSGRLANTVVQLMTIAFYVALMFSEEAVLTLTGIFMASINMIALKLVSRMRTDGNRRLLQEQGKLTGITMSGLQMIETIKATGMEDDFFARFAGSHAKVVNAGQSLGTMSNFLDAVPKLLTSLNSAVILSIGAWDVIHGNLTIGLLIAFQGLMTAFIRPFNSLVDLGGTIQEAVGDMNRIDDVMKAERDPEVDRPSLRGQDRKTSKAKLDGYLEIDNVTFGYSPLDAPLITNFSLKLEPGQRVALIGGSGSGKSTVANLVSGLYQPWSGRILLDNMPRREIPRGVIVNSVAHVSQEIFMFEGKIIDNLRMWDDTVPEEHVVQAAKDACIHDVVAARPGGYYSSVPEGGMNFSGGQRQRLEIARALAVNPSVMIMDEATSALDPLTEYEIDSNLRKRGCTCLIIAHRLSTIRDCDEIIVLSGGEVAERGTHEEMVKNDGPYARLIGAE